MKQRPGCRRPRVVLAVLRLQLLLLLAGCPDYFPSDLIAADVADAARDLPQLAEGGGDAPELDRSLADLPSSDRGDGPSGDGRDGPLGSDGPADATPTDLVYSDLAADLCLTNWSFWSCAGAGPCVATCPTGVFPPLYTVTCDKDGCTCAKLAGGTASCGSTGISCPSCGNAFSAGCCQGL